MLHFNYMPPYESPIEDELARNLAKYLKDEVRLIKQVKIETHVANFRVDFILKLNDRKIAIECDGKEFHEHRRDFVRDALILGYSTIESIYRIQGKNIHYEIHLAILAIANAEPHFFSEKGMRNLTILCDKRVDTKDYEDAVSNPGQDKDDFPVFILATRRDRSAAIWRPVYQHAIENKHLSLARLVEHDKRKEEAFWRGEAEA